MSGGSPVPVPGSDETLQPRLIELLAQLTSATPVEILPETRIFETGLFDSLALVELVGWVETEMGGAVDLSDVDFRAEWATVGDIVEYIRRSSR
jgi:D-alanine--poly(phosphoribitol) ligase subunit 2